MSTIKLISSDLHVADGRPVLDGFGDWQQSALAGLLNAASPGGPSSASLCVWEGGINGSYRVLV